jgi:3-methyladenine DNA glycosylase AlkD
MKARSQSSSTPTKPSKSKSVQKSAKEAWTRDRVSQELRSLGTRRNVNGMAHFGIRAKIVFGVSTPQLNFLARKIRRNHSLALQLWATGIYDAKILAGMIDEPQLVSEAQMERWVRDFDNWATCDGTCCHLFVFSKPAWKKAIAWSKRTKEFEKRAGFALMAYLAIHDKSATDAKYLKLLPMIRRDARDERNFVRKAVNWALRQIGKRNLKLNAAAIREAERIQSLDSRSAKWIAADALRELKSEAVQARLRRKAS